MRGAKGLFYTIVNNFPSFINEIDIASTFDSDKPEIFIDLLKSTPGIIDEISEEKFLKIFEIYKHEQEVPWPNKFKNQPRFGMKLIETNPEIINSRHIQEMAKNDHQLANSIELIKLRGEKEKLDGRIAELEELRPGHEDEQTK